MVAQQLDSRLQASGIRAIVTARAKQPKRLLAKLQQRLPTKRYRSLSDITEDIVDLAGTRVALYFPAQRADVDALIRDQFRILGEPRRFPEDSSHPESYQKRFSGYWARHYRVQLNDSLLKEEQHRYCEAKVEVQVASVLMHAWAEVEHDLVYKPLSGDLSRDELAILDELNGLVLAGEIALERLQTAIEARVRSQGHAFANHYELASYLFESTKALMKVGPTARMLGEVDALFELAKELGIATADRIAPLIRELQTDSEDRPIAEQIIDQILAIDPSSYHVYAGVKEEKVQARSGDIEPPLAIAVDQGLLSRWIELERIVHELEEKRGLNIGRPTSGKLRLLGIVDAAVLGKLESARKIRNQVIHGSAMPTQEVLMGARTDLQTVIDHLQSRLT